jgi:hypothetical protein
MMPWYKAQTRFLSGLCAALSAATLLSPQPSQPAAPWMGLLLLRHALLGLRRPSLSAETLEISNFLIAPCPIGAENFYANVDAFIANEHLWSGDQVFDSMLALAAKKNSTAQLASAWQRSSAGARDQLAST